MSDPNPDSGPPQGRPDAPRDTAPGTPPHQAASQAPPYQAPPPPPPSYSDLESRRRSPLVAGILSLAPGLGQIYLGYYQRGFTHFFTVAATIALLSSASLPDFGYPLLGLFLPFFWLYNIVDASRRAAAVNQALAGGDVAMPDIELPGQGGSMAGGAALIVIGLILLLHTQFDISLEWLETWWPMAPVILGAYLFAKGLRERSGPA